MGGRHTNGMQVKPGLTSEKCSSAHTPFLPLFPLCLECGCWDWSQNDRLRLRGGSCVRSRAGTTGGEKQGPLCDGWFTILFKLKKISKAFFVCFFYMHHFYNQKKKPKMSPVGAYLKFHFLF